LHKKIGFFKVNFINYSVPYFLFNTGIFWSWFNKLAAWIIQLPFLPAFFGTLPHYASKRPKNIVQNKSLFKCLECIRFDSKNKSKQIVEYFPRSGDF